MSNIDFGKRLRTLRQQSHDPRNRKTLSQQRLGELLGEELGAGFSGAAISDWERGESKIHVDDRLLLISLLKILKKNGGLKTWLDANSMLEAGNYRALNSSERDEIFQGEIQEISHPSPAILKKEQATNLMFLLGGIFFNSPDELQKILTQANQGPAPAWPRIAVALVNRITSSWSIFHVLRVLLWLWIWVITYLLIAPSLHLPFTTQENALQAMVLYASGSLILPPFVGALVNTKDQQFWKEQKISNTMATRLYVHQGAYIGFHIGYFIVFSLALIQNQFGLQSTFLFEFIKTIIPLVAGYASAQLVPYNLWLAYKRLHLKDGAVFFVFALLGPGWACFFLEFNKDLGLFTILIAITLLTSAMAIQYRRKKNTIIPILWIVIFYGLILIRQIVSLLIQ